MKHLHNQTQEAVNNNDQTELLSIALMHILHYMMTYHQNDVPHQQADDIHTGRNDKSKNKQTVWHAQCHTVLPTILFSPPVLVSHSQQARPAAVGEVLLTPVHHPQLLLPSD